MCLILLSYHQHPEYPLILAANRDEFYQRPTRGAAWWPTDPNLLAGKDLQGNGTWLGVTRQGRLAAVTNYRNPRDMSAGARSRGLIPVDFLQSDQSTNNFIHLLDQSKDLYAGFNLLCGTLDKLHYYSNRAAWPTVLTTGTYGLCNHLLETPWPKVLKGKKRLAELIELEQFEREDLFELLADTEPAEDINLPDTGIGLEWERTLSSIRIRSRDYGTRVSTLLLIDKHRQVTFCERTFDQNRSVPDREFTFALEGHGS